MEQNAAEITVKDFLVLHKAEGDQLTVTATDEEVEAVSDTLTKVFKRQRNSVLPKIGAKAASWWDFRRWNKELADDLEPIISEIVSAHGEQMANVLGSTFEAAAVVNYIRKIAEVRAKQINDRTYSKILEAVERALESEDEDADPHEAAAHEFDVREGFDAAVLGLNMAKWASGWATEETARQAQNQGIKRVVRKQWVTGPKARPSHAALDGETVGIDERFSNGADWPGDDTLSPDESCGCNCSTRVIVD